MGTTQWEYNDQSVVTKENGPWSSDEVAYGYDGLWRRSSMTLHSSLTTSTSYDFLGRLDSLTSPAGTWNYSYLNNSGLLSQIDNPNGTKSVYSYDTLERLTQVSNQTSTNANLSTFAYGFDGSTDPQRDVRTYVDQTIGSDPTQRVSYAYDGVDQLTGEEFSTGGVASSTRSFAYDAMGNRTSSSVVTASDTYSTSYTPNRLNQYAAINSSWGGGTSTSASALAYDASGNLTGSTVTATGSGSASQSEYSYDDADRLISAIQKDGSGINVSKTTFEYDGLSRLRISKEYTWSGTAWTLVSGSEKRRVYDGMDVVEERDGSNNVVTTYTRDGNIGGLLAKKNNGNFYYFHYDGSGNVVGLSDSTQASVADYSYDAFGNTLSSSGTQANNNLYRYSTKEYFNGSGLYNYGYRFYSPGMGRWINRDPIKERGGINLYLAMGNSPINSVDSYGLDFLGIGRAIGSLVRDVHDYFTIYRPSRALGNPNQVSVPNGDPESEIQYAQDVHQQFGRAGANDIQDGQQVEMMACPEAAGAGTAGEAAGGVASAITKTPLEDGFVLYSASTNSGLVELQGVSEIVDGVLIIHRADIEGPGAASLGLRNLYRLGEQLGRQEGVTKVIIEGSKRSTGLHKGLVPRPIEIPIK